MKIYVGNLPFSIEEGKLKELFSSFGKAFQHPYHSPSLLNSPFVTAVSSQR